jgi:hypothetical protein
VTQQFVVTHTTGQTEIPAALDISVANTPFKILCSQNIARPYILVKMYHAVVLVC